MVRGSFSAYEMTPNLALERTAGSHSLAAAAHRRRSAHYANQGAAVSSRGRVPMIRTVEAVVDPSGNVRLLEDVQLSGPRRALVMILDDAPGSEEAALLSERALADWSRPEEDAAWSHLQPAG